MKQKKVLALVLALCLVFTLSVAAFAADFTDLSSSHWSYDEVSDVVSRGIFLGTSATTFEPEADMTRAMFVTVLSRLAAADVDDNAATAFADVPTGLYYTGAVAWGSTNNLVKGLSATSFGPNQAITREQMATLIVRYAEFAGVTLPETVEAVTFTDEASISDYAKAAVTACQKAGLLNGMEDGSFNPKGTATRAQVATLTSRLAKIDNAITYTVTFNTNGGSEVAAQKVKGGAVATKPATPTKDNATFAGWYADSALTQSYDFDTPVQANITVYAKWNEAGSTSGGGGGGGSSKATSITGFKQPEWTADTPNAENVNKMMTALWTDTPAAQDEADFGFNVEPVFSYKKNTLTVDASKVTEQLTTWITTQWGGTSVPVALTFNKSKVEGVEPDANWNKARLSWIDLANNGTTEVTIEGTKFTYNVEVVGGKAGEITGFAQPEWIAETPNAENVNKMMTALWTDTPAAQDEADFGFNVEQIFSFEGNTLAVDASKVTEQLTTWITTQWGGTSVPVALTFNGDIVEGVEPDGGGLFLCSPPLPGTGCECRGAAPPILGRAPAPVPGRL